MKVCLGQLISALFPQESNLEHSAWSHWGINFVILSNRVDKMLAVNIMIGYTATNICANNKKNYKRKKGKNQLGISNGESA